MCNTLISVKTLTVRLPESLVAALDAEARERGISRSDLVRERLEADVHDERARLALLASIASLIGSVEGLPSDLSSRRKAYLSRTGYGRKRPR